MAIIYANMDLGVIEVRVGEALSECIVWGDLDLSEEEYWILDSKITDSYQQGKGFKHMESIIQRYPKCMTTHILHYILFEYDGSNFWTPWGSKFNLELDPVHQSKIGTLVIAILQDNGFDTWEEGGLKYLTPMICQAGIPMPSFDEVFEIVESTLGDYFFSPQVLLEDINGRKNYRMEKGAERFLRLYKDKSIDLLNSIRFMMQTLGNQDIDLDSAVNLCRDLNPRIIKRFLEWRSEDDTNNQGKASKKHFAPPKLIFDDEGKGTVLMLPEQKVRDDEIYKLIWKVFEDGSNIPAYHKSFPVRIQESYSYINSVNATIHPANTYDIELWSDKPDSQPLAQWKIEGIHTKGFLLFDQYGQQKKDDTMQYIKSSTLILLKGSKVLEWNAVNLIPLNLPGSWSDYIAYTIIPVSKDGFLTISSESQNYKLQTRYLTGVTMVSKASLFGEVYSESAIPVHTRWPKLCIGEEGDAIQDIANWEVRVRNMATGESMNFTKREGNEIEDRFFDLAPISNITEENHFGKYDVRVYRGKELRKTFQFYMAPYIDYRDDLIKEWPTDTTTYERTGFMIEDRPLEYNINFISSKVRQESHKAFQKDWIKATTTDPDTHLFGELKLFGYEQEVMIPFTKTVRKMKWVFWEENSGEQIGGSGSTIVYLDQLSEGSWWLSLHLSEIVPDESELFLSLDDAKGNEMQRIFIKPNSAGNLNLRLSGFDSTIQAERPPFVITLHYSNPDKKEDRAIRLCQIQDRVILKNLKYQLTDSGVAVILWDETDRLFSQTLRVRSITDPNNAFEVDLSKKKTNANKRQFVTLKQALNPGVYLVEPTEGKECFFGDDADELFVLFEFDLEKMLFVNIKEFALDQAISLYDWLVLVLARIKSIENLELIYRSMEKKVEMLNVTSHFERSGKLLISLILNCKDKRFSPEIQVVLDKIIDLITSKVLGNLERGRLLLLLTECSIPYDRQEYLINFLGLHRFTYPRVRMNEEALRLLWDVDSIMAALWILKSEQMDADQIGRLVHLIGTDFLHDAIIMKSKMAEEMEWGRCLRATFMQKPEALELSVVVSADVFGNTQELIDMTDFGNAKYSSKVTLDYKKRKTSGKQLAGTRYLDFLIELFRSTDLSEEMKKANKEAVAAAERAIVSYEKLERTEAFPQEIRSVLEFRKTPGPMHQMCYYSIYFALLEAFSDLKETENNETIRSGNEFFSMISKTIPTLYKRDILLAELYAFMIKKRGAKVCR